jgi:hypothetical protein
MFHKVKPSQPILDSGYHVPSAQNMPVILDGKSISTLIALQAGYITATSMLLAAASIFRAPFVCHKKAAIQINISGKYRLVSLLLTYT